MELLFGDRLKRSKLVDTGIVNKDVELTEESSAFSSGTAMVSRPLWAR
jgi:hypothetical protein